MQGGAGCRPSPGSRHWLPSSGTAGRNWGGGQQCSGSGPLSSRDGAPWPTSPGMNAMTLSPLEPPDPLSPCKQPGLGCTPALHPYWLQEGWKELGGSLGSTGGFLHPRSEVLGAQLGVQHVLPPPLQLLRCHVRSPPGRRWGWRGTGGCPHGSARPSGRGEGSGKNNPWASSSLLWLPAIYSPSRGEEETGMGLARGWL